MPMRQHTERRVERLPAPFLQKLSCNFRFFAPQNPKVKVYCIWNISNSLRLKKSFNNKEEALELYEKINKPILDMILNK